MLDDYTPEPSTEESGYEAVNVVDALLYKKWRTETDTGEYIVFDAGSGNTFTLDSVAVSGHNLSSGATIKFQMHTSDSWGTPDLDETLTWREDHIIHYFTSTAKRFCRFYFDDGSNPDGYIEIGRVTGSQYLQFDPSSLGEFEINNIRNDIVFNTPSNYSYGTISGVGQYRAFRYSFPPTDFDFIDEIRTLYDAVGKVTPFYFMNYDTRFTEIAPAYVLIVNDVTENWKGHNKATYSLELRETGGLS